MDQNSLESQWAAVQSLAANVLGSPLGPPPCIGGMAGPPPAGPPPAGPPMGYGPYGGSPDGAGFVAQFSHLQPRPPVEAAWQQQAQFPPPQFPPPPFMGAPAMSPPSMMPPAMMPPSMMPPSMSPPNMGPPAFVSGGSLPPSFVGSGGPSSSAPCRAGLGSKRAAESDSWQREGPVDDPAASRRDAPMRFVAAAGSQDNSAATGVAAVQSFRREMLGTSVEDLGDLLAPGISQPFGGDNSSRPNAGVRPVKKQRQEDQGSDGYSNSDWKGNNSWSGQSWQEKGEDSERAEKTNGESSWASQGWQEQGQDRQGEDQSGAGNSWTSGQWQDRRDDRRDDRREDRRDGPSSWTPNRGCPANLRASPGAPRSVDRPQGKYRSQAPKGHLSIMMVAEKPAIAQAFAAAMAPQGRYQKDSSGSLPTFSFTGPWCGGRNGNGPPSFNADTMCEYHITSSIGHIYSLDFPPQMRNWHRFDPDDLFDAGPVRNESSPDAHLPQHLADVASMSHVVISCLDCDREGEAIGYEALETIMPNLAPHPQVPAENPDRASYQGFDFANDPRVWRVKFSSLAPNDLRTALTSLVKPNTNEARCVDARAEIDLKVGVALSRLITMNLKDDVGALAPEREGESKKHGALLSYGPCQTPTLGFCVDRWDMIQNFHKQTSNTLDLRVRSPSGSVVTLSWQPSRDLLMTDSQSSKGKGKGKGKKGGAGFNEPGTNKKEALEEFIQQVQSSENAECECEKVDSWETSVERPTALNTVEMLRLSSRELGIDPQRTMAVAEKLYLGGMLTYPRTETTRYPAATNFKEIVQEHAAHRSWGTWCRYLLQDNLTDPREGNDAGDHPPITPVWCASEEEVKRKAGAQMARDAVRIYELVTKNFLASVSPDVKCTRHEAFFDLNGFKFGLKGNEVTDWGFARLFQGAVRSSQNGWTLAQRNLLKPLRLELVKKLEPGMRLKVDGLSIRQLTSSPPKMLSESELLTVMEKEQVGTDASMATHVNNIVVRGYVEVVGDDRRMKPTILGVWLIHGLRAVDAELTQAAVRARIERDVTEVANGWKSCEDVVTQALIVFRKKFQAVRDGIPTLKQMLAEVKEKKDTWLEKAAVQQQPGEEPAEDEAEVVVAPKPLQAHEISRVPPKRPREEQEQPAATAPRNVRARTTAAASSSQPVARVASSASSASRPKTKNSGAAAAAVKAAENGTPAQKLKAENKVLTTKLAIAELRAENAELKFKDMERKFADLDATVATLQSQKSKKNKGKGGKGKG